MSVTIKTTIMRNGTITIGPIDPEAFEHVEGKVSSLAASIAGENPVAYSGCLRPEDEDAIARRLAKMILGEVA
jgi:hypothetical protein